MKLARYVGNGRVEIVDEPMPGCPVGGLLIKVEACGLCSGELMSWYMDQKIPHVLGHEVAGIVVESDDARFPVGSRVSPHHHAPCLDCDFCKRGLFVHCSTWKRTKLLPGGMAEYCVIPAENLADCHVIGDLPAEDAALMEPLACVVKSIAMGGEARSDDRILVIGLGVMSLLHLLTLPNAIGVDFNLDRVEHARSLGLDVRQPAGIADSKFSLIFVCPGSQSAFDAAFAFAMPGARIVMFAPLSPDKNLIVPQAAYFLDLTISHAYSCGPTDTSAALEIIKSGKVTASKVVSNMVRIEDLPTAYEEMKAGRILKAMVIF